MTDAAVILASEVGYISAGTLEFILTLDQKFYFLEMNTRLQVEHPITELTTGIDLASWQIRLAAGQQLTFTQDDLTQRGHALEARIYAEQPSRDFLPSIGEIHFYRPPSGPGVRVDDGIEAGTHVSPYYDPMLAKIITWGYDRQESIRKMIRALQDTVILGVKTNIPYLIDILKHQKFRSGDISVGFLQENMEPWKEEPDTSNSTWLALAAFEMLGSSQSSSHKQADEHRQEILDPWSEIDNWRNVF